MNGTRVEYNYHTKSHWWVPTLKNWVRGTVKIEETIGTHVEVNERVNDFVINYG